VPNLDNIRLWVAALRSGEYQQGFSALHRPEDNTFCCLGVACEIARKSGLDLTVGQLGTSVSYDSHVDYLPLRVQNWLGVDSFNPRLNGTLATELNDFNRASFAEIADAIEVEYNLKG